MKIINMEYAPVIGYQNSEIKRLSKRFAELYNESIDIINNKLFLGFDLKRIDEMKNLTASFNFEENLLEIHVSKGSTIIIPSRRIDIHTACKLFEFTDTANPFDKMHILSESKTNKYSLKETRTGKGKAGSWIADKVSSGISSAMSIVGKEVEIKNAESIDELSKNINESIKKILKFDVGQDKIVDVISGFIRSGNPEDINSLYEKILGSAMKSKYVDEASSKVMAAFKKADGSIKRGGKVFDKEIDKILAGTYKTNPEEIKDRMKSEGFVAKVKKVYTYIANGISVFFDLIKASIASFITYKFSVDGIVTSINKAGGWIIGKILELVQYLIGPSEENVKTAEMLIKSDSWKDNAVGYFNKFVQTGQEAVADGLDIVKSISEGLNNLLSEYITGPLDNAVNNTTSGKIIVYTIVIGIAIYALIKIKNIISNITGIVDESRTDSKDAFMNFNIESLTTGDGFDRIFAIEAVLGIIKANIENAISSSKFSDLEKARLVKINHLIINTSKKHSKGTLSLAVKNVKSVLKDLEESKSNLPSI